MTVVERECVVHVAYHAYTAIGLVVYKPFRGHQKGRG